MSTYYENGHNLPNSVAAWLALDLYKANPDIISATQIMKSTRKLILGNAIAQDSTLVAKPVDVMSLLKSRKGTAVHTALELTWTNDEYRHKALSALGYSQASIDKFIVNGDPAKLKKGQIPVYTERFCSRPLGDYEVGGTADFIIKGVLTDYKNTSTYSYMDKTKDKMYQLQGSIYRWAMPDIVTEDVMDIVETYDDWSAGQSYRNGYPPQPVMVKKIPLMNMKATERFLSTKIQEIEKHMGLPINELPFCSDEDLWRKGDTYKYYKNPTATGRSTNNFDTYLDAQKKHREDGSVGRIDIVKGKAVACRYCEAINICNQAKILIGSGDLVL